MADAYQLESSSDRYLLEDGSGVLLLDNTDLDVALTGQSITALVGTLKADWHITAEAGTAVVDVAVPLVGQTSTAESGTVTAESEANDVSVELVGEEFSATPGTLVPSHTKEVTGADSTAAAGDLGSATDGFLLGDVANALLGTLDPSLACLLDGAECAGAVGDLVATTDVTEALTGSEMVASSGSLTAEGGSVGSNDDLLWLQRQRRFGRETTPLARSRIPRKVR